jgi:hypothetical protein
LTKRRSYEHPLKRIGQTYKGPKPGGYVHLMNVGGAPKNAKIGERIHIRRATADEARAIREMHEWHGIFPAGGHTRNPFETKVERRGDAGDADIGSLGVTSYSTTRLERKDHVYWIAEHTTAQGGIVGHGIYALRDASVLTPWPLEYGAHIRWHNAIAAELDKRAASWFVNGADLDPTPFYNLDSDTLAELADVMERFQRHDAKKVDLAAVVQKYRQIRILPHNELRVLGYFTVLESLITHKPEQEDHTDSLGRQIRTKMVLLGNRFKRPLPYNRLGKGADADPIKTWKALYGYRSRLAHGDHVPTFTGNKDLVCLRSPQRTDEFMRAALVAVMRQALEEPDLIRDLKAC